MAEAQDEVAEPRIELTERVCLHCRCCRSWQNRPAKDATIELASWIEKWHDEGYNWP